MKITSIEVLGEVSKKEASNDGVALDLFKGFVEKQYKMVVEDMEIEDEDNETYYVRAILESEE